MKHFLNARPKVSLGSVISILMLSKVSVSSVTIDGSLNVVQSIRLQSGYQSAYKSTAAGLPACSACARIWSNSSMDLA